MSDLVERLLAMRTAEAVPREEWEWLAAHGTVETFPAGSVITTVGERVEHLWLVLRGCMAAYVNRAGVTRRVGEWRAGDVTGRLPYSRMSVVAPERSARTEEPTEALGIHERSFPELVNRCPVFTTWCVHMMIDRAHMFSAAALQEEKMASLGKLAAGLAHELNNPASATVRAATHLLGSLEAAEVASRDLAAAGATPQVLAAIERVRTTCMGAPSGIVRSPVEQADHEDAIAAWLSGKGLDTSLAGSLVDTSATIADLDALANGVPPAVLPAAVRWIASGCSTRALASEISDSAKRVGDLVAAVKRFTYMDTMAGVETMQVAPGLRDTARVLSSKAKAKGVGVAVHEADDIRPVRAIGGELNQVWMNVIDNAIDASPEGGTVAVEVRMELDYVAVCVTDNGPGVPEELQSRIFDPFVTTKPLDQGTGLGLDVARRLLRAHHGEITLDSAPGRTTFCVRLPAAPDGVV